MQRVWRGLREQVRPAASRGEPRATAQAPPLQPLRGQIQQDEVSNKAHPVAQRSQALQVRLMRQVVQERILRQDAQGGTPQRQLRGQF